MNAVEIADAVADLAAQPFEAAEFPFQFLAAFDKKETQLKRLRKGDTNRSDIPGGVLLQSNIHLAVCRVGETHVTLGLLKGSSQTAKAKAKFILATDGETLEAEELSTGESIASEFAKLAEHIGFFLPLAGISTVREIKDNPVDIRATAKLNKLYVELLRQNPEWGSDARRHDMNHFMARLIFCFFAEDTDIFDDRGLFTNTIEQFSESDGSNTDQVIEACFHAMNTKVDHRPTANLPGYTAKFKYVNGGLFAGSTGVPKFTRIARSYLLQAGGEDWQHINPDIFGSMIQAVADKSEREQLGMHYTSVPNILKVLNPLFLDEMRAQLEAAGTNPRTLLNLRKRLSRIRVFDPACGSGNFLVIAYKELRKIEAEINLRRGEAMLPSEISKKNFRGIEVRDFAAEIARLALVIAEYQCDVLHRGPLAAKAEFLPLDEMNWITWGNSLQLDWLEVCPPEGTQVRVREEGKLQFDSPEAKEIDFENEGGETYICGNPPYQGYSDRTPEQNADMDAVFTGWGNVKRLDYIACWFAKASTYARHENARFAFVATNSICQGEQVSLLWPPLFITGLEIFFAHQSFDWRNNARGNAGVTCVIVGMRRAGPGAKFIFGEGAIKSVENISPYLIEGPNLVMAQRTTPLSELPDMALGSSSIDGGHLIMDKAEYRTLVAEAPESAKFIKPFVGGADLINGIERFCVWIGDAEVLEASSIPAIKNRIDACREYRLGAGRDAKKAASVPYRFFYRKYRNQSATVVPMTSSSRRQYLPALWVPGGTVVSHGALVVYDSSPYVLSILSSKLHTVWLATTSARMRTDYRYSVNLTYFTFPLPQLTLQDISDLTRCAEDILLARETHFPDTIAVLYDPEGMPKDLRAAHDRNDETLERIYIGRRFRNDTERLETLFTMYAKMTVGAGSGSKSAASKPRGSRKNEAQA